MHLGIDVREACSERRTGKGQWTYGFVSELLTRSLSLTLFTDRELPPEWKVLLSDRIRTRLIETSGARLHLDIARLILGSPSIDAYVSPVSYIVPALIGKQKAVIPVVHDLIAFRGEPHDRKAVFIEKLTLKRALANAAGVCTVSETTKNDLLEKFPASDASRIIPIFAGPMSQPISSSKESAEKIILSIGTLCPRKNQFRLIQAFTQLSDALRSESRLVLVGKRGWNDSEIVRLAKETQRVEWRDYLPDDECEKILSSASVFAFPSLYEGFGMPILDAFRARVPVLTSDLGSMKEVAGDAALLIHPESSRYISRGLERLLTDENLRREMIEKGVKRASAFSWARTIDLFLGGLERLTISPS